MNGLGACHAYGLNDPTAGGNGCPYAVDGWCDCNGITVAPLSATATSIMNCDYTIQPTAGSCPVNSAYSASVVAASEAAYSSSVAAAQPTQTASDNHGSALCASIGGGTCKAAYAYYNDNFLYQEYTSYIQNAGNSDAINLIFGANDGCCAKFTCSDDGYKKGMTGAQIKSAFDNLFKNDGVSTCGTSQLSNGCSVSVDGCDDCQPTVPCDALPLSSLQNGYPCVGTRPPDGLDRTCKVKTVYGGGRASIVLSRTCDCTDGSSPQPFVQGQEYVCPDEAPGQ